MPDDKNNPLLRCIGLLLLTAAVVATLAVAGKGAAITQPTVLSLAVAPGEPSLLYAGTSAGIYVSADRGTTWRLTLDWGGNYQGIAVDPNDPATVYAAPALWGDSHAHALAVDPRNTNTLYAYSYFNGFFKSTDGGLTWARAGKGLPGPGLSRAGHNIVVDPGNTSTVYVIAPRRGIYRSTDGGHSFRRIAQPGAPGPRRLSVHRTGVPACPALGQYESVAELQTLFRMGDLRGKPYVWSNVCGPHEVLPGVGYRYTAVVTNIGYRTYRDLELSVTPDDPLRRTLVWTRKRLEPGRSIRVNFTLAFRRRNDPVGSNFQASVSTRRPLRSESFGTFDVRFVRNRSGTSRTLPRPLGAGHQRLSPGVHVLDLVSREHGDGPADLPRIAITLPRGWFNYDGWGVLTGERTRLMLVSFWDVDLVYETPCRWKSKSLIDPGPGVDALASALVGRPLRNATRPKDTVLDGFRGKYLQWSVPRQIDFAACDEGAFESWTARGWASDRYQQGPGQVDRIWILNVGGTRLVVDVAYMPQATQADRQALERIVRSIRFLR